MKPVFKNKVNNCIKKPFLSTEFFNKEKSKQFQKHTVLYVQEILSHFT